MRDEQAHGHDRLPTVQKISFCTVCVKDPLASRHQVHHPVRSLIRRGGSQLKASSAIVSLQTCSLSRLSSLSLSNVNPYCG